MPAALSIGMFTSSFSRIIAFRKYIRWSIVKWFVPAAIPAVWLGAYLLKFLNPIYLELAMGIFLISNIPMLLKKPKEVHLVKRPSNYLLVIIGFLAGFLSGLTGAVGLLFNKFYLRYQLSKEEIVATRAANEIIMHLIKIVLYTLFGLITMKVIWMGIVVAVSALLSTWTMKTILPRLSDFLFKKVGYGAMVISGFVILAQSGGNILRANQGGIGYEQIPKGLETQLRWQSTSLELEFTYDEGFEFEQAMPFSELTPEQQSFVKQQYRDYDTIIIEAVYSLHGKTHEAYYFKNKKLVKQIDFE